AHPCARQRGAPDPARGSRRPGHAHPRSDRGNPVNHTQQLLADDPWWLIAGKAVVVFGFLVVMTLFNIWFERRVVARMQHRIGPNVHGPFGLLQSLADGVKLALKEDIIPKAADRVVFLLAPILATVPAVVAFAGIPFGPQVR